MERVGRKVPSDVFMLLEDIKKRTVAPHANPGFCWLRSSPNWKLAMLEESGRQLTSSLDHEMQTVQISLFSPVAYTFHTGPLSML